MVAGFIFLVLLDWICWDKISYLVFYSICIAVGFIGFASTRRCWSDNKKVQMVCCGVYAFIVLWSGGGACRELLEFKQNGQNQALAQEQQNTTSPAEKIAAEEESAHASVFSKSRSEREDCSVCYGLKTCSECYGDGDYYCTYCLGGRCIACDNGKILSGFDFNGNARYIDCPDCSGGRCSHCRGTGRIDCTYCVGGKCPACNGTGHQ